jgi:hypothetical protein
MDEKYQIYRIDPGLILDEQVEDGMLRKDWYLHPQLGKCLFKEAAPTQAIISDARTDWTEKVVNEIANLLGLPVARYELATGYFGKSTKLVEGVVSINCVPTNAQVFTGEEFLTRILDCNLDDPRQYTIENVLKALDLADVNIPSNWQQPIAGIDTGAKLFVGYMMLDCLVNNSDRHDHNWEVMAVGERIELVSSFDHGLSLGSTDEDEDKPTLSLADYVERYSQSCFQEGYNKLPTLTIFERCGRLYPDAARIWQEQLRQVTMNQIEEIFSLIPEGRITPVAAKFAIELLDFNQKRIVDLEIDFIKLEI